MGDPMQTTGKGSNNRSVTGTQPKIPSAGALSQAQVVMLDTISATKEELQAMRYVMAGNAVAERLSVPLVTTCLTQCCSLIVVDVKNKRHMLAHVTGGEGPNGASCEPTALANVRNALGGINVNTSIIWVVSGASSEGTAREVMRFLTNEYAVRPGGIRFVPARYSSGAGENCISVQRGDEIHLFRAMKCLEEGSAMSRRIDELIDKSRCSHYGTPKD